MHYEMKRMVRRLHAGLSMMMRALMLCLAVFGLSGLSGLAGCSSSNSDQPDLAEPAPPDLATAAPDLLLPSRDPSDHPQLISMRRGRGPVMDHIEVWTVVWQGDEALGDRVNRFLDWMLTSDYWAQSTAEYGVGPGVAKGVLVIPQKPPATLDDSSIDGLLQGYITSGLFPTPNGKTAFSFILSPKTMSTMFGSRGCNAYEGYHSEAQLAAGTTPYLVNLQCGSGTNFNSLTEVISHEVSEASTDPYPFSARGYVAIEDLPLGGEISDLCAGLGATYSTTQDVPDGGTEDVSYFVTRNWSNAAVKAGDRDPCQPVVNNRPYFNVAVNPINVLVDTSAGDDITEVDAAYEPYALGDVGLIKWSLAYEPDSGITVVPSSGQGKAGQTIPLKIRVASTVRAGTYAIYLITDSAHGGGNQWVSTITVQ